MLRWINYNFKLEINQGKVEQFKLTRILSDNCLVKIDDIAKDQLFRHDRWDIKTIASCHLLLLVNQSELWVDFLRIRVGFGYQEWCQLLARNWLILLVKWQQLNTHTKVINTGWCPKEWYIAGLPNMQSVYHRCTRTLNKYDSYISLVINSNKIKKSTLWMRGISPLLLASD